LRISNKTRIKLEIMKIYTLESNALKATITKGITTKFDWTLKIEAKCGGKLICEEYQNIFLTKKAAVNMFKIINSKPFLIKN